MTGLEPSDPTYGFPFKPYKQQQDLMAHLYRAIAGGQVTVIESPTGTVSGHTTGPGARADTIMVANAGQVTLADLVFAVLSARRECARSLRTRRLNSRCRRRL